MRGHWQLQKSIFRDVPTGRHQGSPQKGGACLRKETPLPCPPSPAARARSKVPKGRAMEADRAAAGSTQSMRLSGWVVLKSQQIHKTSQSCQKTEATHPAGSLPRSSARLALLPPTSLAPNSDSGSTQAPPSRPRGCSSCMRGGALPPPPAPVGPTGPSAAATATSPAGLTVADTCAPACF